MNLAIPFPDLSPELFSIEIGPFAFALRWYALAYIAGLLIGLWLMRRALARPGLFPGAKAPFAPEQADELLTWSIIGVILGGRLGFVLFYQPDYYLAHPFEILKVWQGGMAFHGGLMGVVIAAWAFARKYQIPKLQLADLMTLATPPGLLLGRLANFINGELWGRPTDLPWGVIFPGIRAQECPGFASPCARHPSQLYEAGLEGLLLGLALLWLVYRRDALKTPGRLAGVFFLGYGLARFVVEFFRQADPQFITPDNPWGHVLGSAQIGITMGQALSLPMVALGLVLLLISRRASP
ncbi:MAG: prolipoprotein diacylglyceryl transferase [Mangrovicoccus sp.]|nr:prolipoprotein diacylglyceryl transferase [Mangrovicoccus sp.]